MPMNTIADLQPDARYAVRTLRRAPAFTFAAVTTLALGIGASTAVFTLIDSVLLRPLRFADSERLVMIRPNSGARLSAAYLHEWRLQNTTLDDLAAWRDVHMNLTGREGPIEVLTDQATSNFFALLGTPPLIGRTFTTSFDLARVEREVVLSHGFWQRRFGSTADVLGRAITLDGETFTIVGVMPAGFTVRTTELAESRAELWTPLALVPGDRVGMGGALHGIARARVGVTVDQAQSDLSRIARQIENEFPSYSRDWRVDVVALLDATVRDVRPTLLLLFGAVSILLLVSCANVANLVLGRGVTRQAELATRFALGATRVRLVRQLLTESLVLAGTAGAIGTGLAWWGTRLLVLAIPPGLELPRTADITVDARVLAFALVVTALASVVFGRVPALRGARAEPLAARGVARGVSMGRRGVVAGGLLITAEVALTLVLLAGAGLLVRSFLKLGRVDPGFEAQQVLTMSTTLPRSTYDTDDKVRRFSAELLERVSRLPGVRASGSANYVPMSRTGAAATFDIEGQPAARPEDRHGAWVSVVGGRYFEAMAIPLVRGRLPDLSDTERTLPVLVIDESLARRHWPAEDAVGARLLWHLANGKTFTGEVVGVVGSVRWGGMDVAPQATAYWWQPQVPNREITLVASVDGSAVAVASAIGAQVRAMDPDQPVSEIRSMEAFVSASLARARFTTWLLGSFSAVALFLAAIGLYSVMSFWVTQRSREFGLRMALGARSADVLRLVMRRSLPLVSVGLGLGTLLALASGGLVAGLLFGVTPQDPATLVGAAAFLAGVCAIATYVPARRATAGDPIEAFKE
jgi:putative ABC transport system permease protein